MAFEISLAGFFEFLAKPFTNPIGWVLLIGAGAWIYLRVKGKIGRKKDNEGRGGSGADYVIK